MNIFDYIKKYKIIFIEFKGSMSIDIENVSHIIEVSFGTC